MKKIRIIPRLDIKNDTVVKGIHLEGLRVVGKPDVFARQYYQEGADEFLYMDTVASLYERNSLNEIISKAARQVFVPMTVGGGIRKLDDISQILNSGADKVAINTAAVREPAFLKEAVSKFGAQCIVLSVEAKKIGERKWEAYTESGREKSGRLVLDWVREALDHGVGEVLLTSVDRDGTKNGVDIDLIQALAPICTVPLIISGGVGKKEDVLTAFGIPGVDALAIGSAYHYGMFSIPETKAFLMQNHVQVRL
jgi:imidazole glycerol-phosphate synthase subunit HisF